MDNRYSLFFDKKDIDTVSKETFTATQKQMDDISDDTLRLANSALSKVIEAEQIGVDTLVALDTQGDQLKGTQDGVDQILENQSIARRSLFHIAHWFGGLFNKVTPEPKLPQHSRDVDKILAKTERPVRPATPPVSRDDEPGFLKLNQSNASKWRQTDDVLDQIDDHIHNLGGIATQMGEEIREHNTRLDVLNSTAETAVDNMHELTSETNRIRRGL